MKFGKPVYVADKKIYKCEVSGVFRCESKCENNTLTPQPESLLSQVKGWLIPGIIENTKGWFSKPLTEAWLSDKINIHYPKEDIPEGFEGNIEWEVKELIISKDSFLFNTAIVEKKEFLKVLIEFPEEVPPEPKQKEGVRRKDNLTREQFKELVRRERDRAGRALFRAERLTQEYCELYGEETDWEESDEEEEN